MCVSTVNLTRFRPMDEADRADRVLMLTSSTQAPKGTGAEHKALLDTQTLLGRKSKAMTDKYNDDRGKDWKVLAV